MEHNNHAGAPNGGNPVPRIQELIQNGKFSKVVMTLRAVDHKLRQRMIDLLSERGKMTAIDFSDRLRLDETVTAQHLSILCRAGIFQTERIGNAVFYYINQDRIAHISRFVKDLVSYENKTIDIDI